MSTSINQQICCETLFLFLCGTYRKQGNVSPLQILEGQGDVLRLVLSLYLIYSIVE